MKSSYFIFLLIVASLATQAQSLKKSFKLLDEKQFDLAATELAEVMAKDSTNPQLWYGLALLNSDAAYSSSDLFYAWNCINKSITLFSALDEKEKNKFGESLNITLLNELRTQIDDKLYKQVSASSNMELFLKHLSQCNGSRHTADVMLLRNALAFKNAESQNTVDAYDEFLAKYPSAKEKDQAITKRNSAAFKKVLEKNTSSAFQQFMNNYPGAAEYQMAFDLRNELMLDSAIALNAEKPIREFISNMQKQNTQEHPVSPALMDRANNAIQKLTAKDHWIVFLSQGNLFKMNEADFQKQQLTTAGNVFSFKCTAPGDIVYTTVNNNIMQFFVLTQNNRKICELKSPDSFSTDFLLSDDLDSIYVNFGEFIDVSDEQTVLGSLGLWDTQTNKWEICGDPYTCNIDPPAFTDIKYHDFPSETACLNDNPQKEFFLMKTDIGIELYCKDEQGNSIKISNTENIHVSDHVQPSDNPCFTYVVFKDKVLFSLTQDCVQWCVGPTFIVNADGSNQVQVSEFSQIDDGGFEFLFNDDLISINDSHKLIMFTGKENQEIILGDVVTQFDLMYVAPMDSFCLSSTSDEDVEGVTYTSTENNIFRIQGTTVTAELYSSYARNGSNAESTETEFSGTITDNKIVGNAIRKSYSQYGDLSGTESIPMEFTFSRISKESIEINGQLYNSCK